MLSASLDWSGNKGRGSLFPMQTTLFFQLKMMKLFVELLFNNLLESTMPNQERSGVRFQLPCQPGLGTTNLNFD